MKNYVKKFVLTTLIFYAAGTVALLFIAHFKNIFLLWMVLPIVTIGYFIPFLGIKAEYWSFSEKIQKKLILFMVPTVVFLLVIQYPLIIDMFNSYLILFSLFTNMPLDMNWNPAADVN